MLHFLLVVLVNPVQQASEGDQVDYFWYILFISPWYMHSRTLWLYWLQGMHVCMYAHVCVQVTNSFESVMHQDNSEGVLWIVGIDLFCRRGVDLDWLPLVLHCTIWGILD